MAKGNWMSQSVRTFDQGGVNPQRVRNSLTCFFLQIWSPILGDSGASTHQIWSPILEDNGTDTHQACSLNSEDSGVTHVRPDPLMKELCTRTFWVQNYLWLIFCADIFTRNRRRDPLIGVKMILLSKLTNLLELTSCHLSSLASVLS